MPYQIIMALALPVFLGLVWLEYYISKIREKKYFSFSSSITNISIGIAERLSQLFLAGYFAVALGLISRHFGLFHIEKSLLSWIILFILTDFLWYWYHRLSHTVNLFWGAHIVHHQCEDYNLTVSFRITFFQALIRFVFYLPLPILGFSGEMILVTFSICGIYQFFIHTRLIHKLGWLEEILVTPSHHRVHHGSNAVYIDKNYGGVFILWDRIFQTFQRETEEVQYGLTKQVDSNSFLWLHFHLWLTMAENFKRRKSLSEKLHVLFGGPDDISYDYDATLRKKYLLDSNRKRTISHQLHTYIWTQIVLVITVLFVLYLIPQKPLVLGVATLLTVLTLINCGAILEQKRWIFPVEITRFFAVYILLLLSIQNIYLAIFLPIVIVAIIWKYNTLQRYYLKLLYVRNT